MIINCKQASVKIRNAAKYSYDFTTGFPSALLPHFNRNQSRYVWNNDGSLTNLGLQDPPMSYDNGVLAYEPSGVITARWTNSNVPSNASFVKNGYTVTATTITAPDPALTSTFVQENATNTVHEFARNQAATSGTSLVVHLVLKSLRKYLAIIFKTTNGAFLGETIVFGDLTGNNASVFSTSGNVKGGCILRKDGHYEIWAQAVASASATATISLAGCDDSGVYASYMGDTSKGFYLFNMQNFASRKKPPVVIAAGSTVTLNADRLRIPSSFFPEFTGKAMSFIVDSELSDVVSQSFNHYPICAGLLSDATLNNRGGAFYSVADNLVYGVLSNAGSAQSNAVTAKSRIGVSVQDKLVRIATDTNVARTYQSSVQNMPAFDLIYIGSSPANSSHILGRIKKVDIYPNYAFSRSELVRLCK